jgi:YD repeat-containing protein
MGGKIGYDARYAVLQQTEYTYDNRRLSSIISNRKPVVTYKYDAGGRPVLKTYGNGIQASLSYDAMGHLSRIIFAGGPIPVPLTLAYVWDQADQVVQRSWNGEVLHYDYDAGGRLAKVTHVIDDKTSEVLEAYAYDKAGNITAKTLQGEKTTLAYNCSELFCDRSVSRNWGRSDWGL